MIQGPCVCVQARTERVYSRKRREREPPEGSVCEISHTATPPYPVWLVRFCLVLVWYYYCYFIYSCSTRSSTTTEVRA